MDAPLSVNRDCRKTTISSMLHRNGTVAIATVADWVSLTGSRQWIVCELDANRLQLGIVDMSKLTRTD